MNVKLSWKSENFTNKNTEKNKDLRGVLLYLSLNKGLDLNYSELVYELKSEGKFCCMRTFRKHFLHYHTSVSFLNHVLCSSGVCLVLV